MRIGLDLSTMGPGRTGVGQYATSLADALLRHPDVEEVHGFLPAAFPVDGQLTVPAGLIMHMGPGARRLRWLMRSLRREAARTHLDVFHFPNYFVTPGLGIPTVVTVHDMTAWLFPSMLPLRRRLAHRYLFPGSLARATRVIAVSEVSRQDLVARFPAIADRVSVIQEAPPADVRPTADPVKLASVRQRYGLPPRFILAVGAREPRKNLGRLVRAVNALHDRGFAHPLVITSASVHPPAWIDAVLDLGYVPAQDLGALYGQADVFVYPSLYEGFGLPPLEAMQSGTPVVASSAGAIHEVCGDAALLVDPLDWEAMAGALARVLGDPGLREDLRRKGILRAAQFSWDEAARQTVNVYRAAMAVGQ
jgi:glycosyltransferase involved in cell wall biosynthesis